MPIKKTLPFFLLAALISGTVFLWYQVPLPCGRPLSYSLGTFDARFGISEEAFLKEAATAERLWETALGKELFQYVPGAAFKLNLVFDIRQEQTLEGKKLEDSLDRTQTTQESLDQKQKKVLAKYTEADQDYERRLTAFKKHLDAYNAEVKMWNKQGGAPPEEYQNLQDIADALEKEQRALEEKRQEVNRLAEAVNTFSKQQVAVVEAYNEQIKNYVNRYGEPGEFDQGDYAGQEINIYQYDDLPHLRAVLTHEFGHALGLSHGNDPQSVMYHLMKDQELNPLTLTSEDRAMLLAQCERGVWDVIRERLDLLKQGLLSPKN